MTRWLEMVSVLAFAGLTLDVLWGVFSRYVLAHQSRWTEEVAIYLLIWVSLLGAALAYAEHAHLGVDYLLERLEPQARRLALALIELIVLAFAGSVLIYGGAGLVSRTLQSHQQSPSLGVDVGFLYLAAPISGVCFAWLALDNLLDVLSGDPPGGGAGAFEAEQPGQGGAGEAREGDAT